MSELADLKRRLARLEQAFSRGFILAMNPIPGATPEAFYADSLTDAPSSETVQLAPYPGCELILAPGCQIMIANETEDPVMIGGVGTPAAITMMQARRAQVAAQGGGIIILDPTAGTGGLIITPLGVDVIGALTNNGSPLP